MWSLIICNLLDLLVHTRCEIPNSDKNVTVSTPARLVQSSHHHTSKKNWHTFFLWKKYCSNNINVSGLFLSTELCFRVKREEKKPKKTTFFFKFNLWQQLHGLNDLFFFSRWAEYCRENIINLVMEKLFMQICVVLCSGFISRAVYALTNCCIYSFCPKIP